MKEIEEKKKNYERNFNLSCFVCACVSTTWLVCYVNKWKDGQGTKKAEKWI